MTFSQKLGSWVLLGVAVMGFMTSSLVIRTAHAGACTDAGGACASIPGAPTKPAICGPIPDPCTTSPGYTYTCDCSSRPDSPNTHLCYCEAS